MTRKLVTPQTVVRIRAAAQLRKDNSAKAVAAREGLSVSTVRRIMSHLFSENRLSGPTGENERHDG